MYTENGRVYKRVQNARDLDDAQPALLTLPPGTYKIEAEAKGVDPGTLTVVAPVTIQARRITHVHLDGQRLAVVGYGG